MFLFFLPYDIKNKRESPMKRLFSPFVKNACWMAGVAILLRGANVLFQSYLSRTVGAEGMGLYNLVGILYGFALTLSLSGIPFALTRTLSECLGRGDIQGAHTALRKGGLYALLFAGGASLLLYLPAPLYAKYLLGDLRAILPLRILALSLLPTAIASLFSGYFTAVGRVRGSTLTQLAEMGVRISLTSCLLSYLLPRGMVAACIAMVLGSVLSQCLGTLLLFVQYKKDTARYLLPPPVPHATKGKSPLMKIAMPVAFSSYVRSGLLTVEHMLIPICLLRSGVSHETALASYGILSAMALPLILYPMGILSSFSPLLVPHFAKQKVKENKEGIRRESRLALALALGSGVLCGGVFFTFAGEMGELFYHSQEAASYIRPLSFVIPLMFLDHVTDGILRGLGEEVYTMWVNISDSLLSILLVLCLLPSMGAMGYVYVVILAEAANLLFSLSRLLRVTGLGATCLLGAWRAVGATLLAWGVVTSLTPVTHPSLFWLLLRLVLFFVVFCGVMCAFLPDKRGERFLSLDNL